VTGSFGGLFFRVSLGHFLCCGGGPVVSVSVPFAGNLVIVPGR